MADRRGNDPRGEKGREEKGRDAASYYQLNTKAVDDLVTADADNSPEVRPAELRKYTRRSGLHLAEGFKVFLAKWWIAGVVCYFFVWGLPAVLATLDHLLILGAVLGLATDLLTNNILRYMTDTRGKLDRWMMFPQTGPAGLVLNVVYGCVMVFLTYMTYTSVNAAYVRVTGVQELLLQVGPILFGTFTAVWDMLLLLIRHGFRRIIDDAKRKAGGQR